MTRPRMDGRCALCEVPVTKQTASRHLATCATTHDRSGSDPGPLLHLRAESPGMPFYWIDLEAKATARLTDVDRFLRRLWLECCGHFSVFHVGSTTYTRAMAGGFGERDERSLSARLGDALSGIHGWFGYEYDFGSTTALRLRVVGVREGAIGGGTVRLLARNAPPAWRCSACNEPAALVCSLCNQETDECFVCRRHAGEHACEMKTEGLLPVVNSPRMGVCGYTGEQARAGWRPSDGK